MTDAELLKRVKKFQSNNSNLTKSIDEKQAMKYAEEMKQILRRRILHLKSQVTREAFLDVIDIYPKVLYKKDSSGNAVFEISIGFYEPAIMSESLNRSGNYFNYWTGENSNSIYLPLLYNSGSIAKDYVYGYDRHGSYIRSRKTRPAYQFIQGAVQEFNSKYKSIGIVAKANEKYKPRNGGDMLKATDYFKN